MKRKAEKILKKGGEEPNPDYKAETEVKEDTPDEIKKRPILTARRPIRQPVFDPAAKSKFTLNKSIVSLEEEESLLAPSKPISFLPTPAKEDRDEKEAVKEEEKPGSPAESPEKTEELLPVEDNCPVKAEAMLSVNENNTRDGFLELVETEKNKKYIFVFRNTVKNIVYQAVVLPNSQWTECTNLTLKDNEPNLAEMEIKVYRKEEERIACDSCRISVSIPNKNRLIEALRRIKT